MANELNLRDMSGNVYEWVWGWHGSYSSGELTDPAGPASGTYRRCKGGAFDNVAANCAVAHNGVGLPFNTASDSGFRVLAAAQ
jgi:formylglycine-generating enzyme required for sulfatase activity